MRGKRGARGVPWPYVLVFCIMIFLRILFLSFLLYRKILYLGMLEGH